MPYRRTDISKQFNTFPFVSKEIFPFFNTLLSFCKVLSLFQWVFGFRNFSHFRHLLKHFQDILIMLAIDFFEVTCFDRFQIFYTTCGHRPFRNLHPVTSQTTFDTLDHWPKHLHKLHESLIFLHLRRIFIFLETKKRMLNNLFIFAIFNVEINIQKWIKVIFNFILNFKSHSYDSWYATMQIDLLNEVS